jgi:ABC-type sugar transport system permease subunit
MLEPLPALTSLLAVLFYVKSRSRWNRWALLSAVALGLTAASKYLYCVAGLAILAHWLWVSRPDDGLRSRAAWRRWLWPVALWGLVSLAVFWAADPYLWADPFGRLEQSLLFHGAYAQSAHVRQVGYPLWQPFVWLMGPVPWHPGVFVVALDLYITLLAGLGLRRMWRQQPVFGLWLGLALGFLLVWPTKWPQYILILTAPLSLAAAEGFRSHVWEPLARFAQRRTARSQEQVRTGEGRLARREGRQAVAWLLPGLLVLTAIAVFPLLFQGAMALTDFSTFSIRDGLQGGVWRAVWQGFTGHEPPVPVDASGAMRVAQIVHYVGPRLILQYFLGALPDTLAFELLWTALSVLIQTLLGVSAALMLHRRGVRFRGLWRAVYILPWAIPEFVGALVWLRIFEPRFGWLAMAVNVPKDVPQPQWFTNPNSTFLILLVAATWYGFPFIMLAATAGLKLIPVEVYEAAAIDGATPWEQFRFVTWPMLLPLLVPAVIIRMIFAFNQFYLFITMRPPTSLQTFATRSYNVFSPTGPYGGQFAVSAAMNIFTVFVLVILIAWFNRWSRASEGVTYA